MSEFTVKLVSMTLPQGAASGLTPEEFIAYTARVSNPANQMNNETAPKLIKYLLAHQHYSPFEMADFAVEITTSRAIAAQILRHWSASFQEFSQRYAQAAECIIYPARRQDTKNRQYGIYATVSMLKP
jgi:thymidylate synthase (FAD)